MALGNPRHEENDQFRHLEPCPDGAVAADVRRTKGEEARMLDDVVNTALAPRTLAAVLTGIAAAATVFTLVNR